MIWWYCATVGKFCKTLRSLSMSSRVGVLFFPLASSLFLSLSHSVSFQQQLHLPHSPSFPHSLPHSPCLSPSLPPLDAFFISSCVRFVLPLGILFWLLCILCVNVSYECLCPFRARLLHRGPWNISDWNLLLMRFSSHSATENAHKVWLS